MNVDSLIQLVTDHQIVSLVVAAIAASGIQLKVTKWVALESGRVKMLVTAVISAASAVVPAALGYLSANPEALGAHTAIFFTGMTFAYKFIVTPLSKLLEDAKAYRQENTGSLAATTPQVLDVEIPAKNVADLPELT